MTVREMTEAKRTTQQTGQHGIGGISSPDDSNKPGMKKKMYEVTSHG